MKFLINLILMLLVLFLGFVLYKSVQEPISFKTEKTKRDKSVQSRLMQVRTAQEMFRGITGKYAHNFDTLSQVLKTEDFANVIVMGDPDDPTGKSVFYDTIFVPAIDSVATIGFNIDSLRYIPYSGGKTFDIQADTLTYQSTLVNVMEVKTLVSNYMGPFAHVRYSKYDDKYDPGNYMKIGDMSKPNTSGNW